MERLCAFQPSSRLAASSRIATADSMMPSRATQALASPCAAVSLMACRTQLYESGMSDGATARHTPEARNRTTTTSAAA